MKTNSNLAILKMITLGDKILVVVLIAVGMLSLVALQHLRSPGGRVIIEVSGRVVAQKDLGATQEIVLTGPIGKTIVHIHQGSARVIHSDCPEKICVKTGPIRRAGEMIICVPNKVVVKIEGIQKNPFDVITQ
ncbi:MAG: NusG domain II-containing protein [candidate division KSB1 bacterium]|nr:NusG domain II-containing protein [candidate division KSB1 bacterium]MDZ7358908.1 NusG domain II-containing protein [candidate division KSB1 bacterium]MDZ7399697.1 NusG domain II-containing protein [candidate division KSB1 bacterium]